MAFHLRDRNADQEGVALCGYVRPLAVPESSVFVESEDYDQVMGEESWKLCGDCREADETLEALFTANHYQV